MKSRELEQSPPSRSLLLLAAIVVVLCQNANVYAKEPATQLVRPHNTISKLPSNHAVDLGPYNCTDVQGEHAGRCRLITDYSGMAYDKNRHRMVIFGGGHASTNYDGINTFDLNTLRWIEEYPPTPCSSMTADNYDFSKGFWRKGRARGPYPRPAARHTADQLIVVEDELIVLAFVEGNYSCPNFPTYTSYDFASGASISHYNFVTKTWSFPDAAGGVEWPGTAYDPVSKKIVLLGQVGLYIYDPVTKTKTTAIDLRSVYVIKDEQGKVLPGGVNYLGYNQNLVYFPPNQRFYYFVGGEKWVYELNLNRSNFSQSTITRLATTGTPPPGVPIGYAYDSTNNIIGGGPVRNTFYAYDPLTKAWRSTVVQGGAPGSVAFHAIDYDPINNVFIFVTDEAGGRKTWAYRYAR